MAGAESELLDHIKSRKLGYFGHVTRLPHDNIESSVMTGLLRASEAVEDRGCAGWTASWRRLACRGSACCTLHVTDVAGRQLLIYAANRRSATTAL